MKYEVTFSARLEQCLNTLIGIIAGFNDLSDPMPFIMINHISVSQKNDILSAMCEERLSELPHLENYKAVIGEAKNAIVLRNKYVHNSMLFDAKEKKCVLANASARGKLKIKIEYVGLDDVEKVSKQLARVMRMLHNLILNTKHPVD